MFAESLFHEIAQGLRPHSVLLQVMTRKLIKEGHVLSTKLITWKATALWSFLTNASAALIMKRMVSQKTCRGLRNQDA